MSIQGTLIKNGSLRLILTGSDGIDEEALKQLDGATVRFVSENVKLFDKNLTGALILEVIPKARKDEPEREVENLVPDTKR
jgi:hypothetical protein